MSGINRISTYDSDAPPCYSASSTPSTQPKALGNSIEPALSPIRVVPPEIVRKVSPRDMDVLLPTPQIDPAREYRDILGMHPAVARPMRTSMVTVGALTAWQMMTITIMRSPWFLEGEPPCAMSSGWLGFNACALMGALTCFLPAHVTRNKTEIDNQSDNSLLATLVAFAIFGSIVFGVRVAKVGTEPPQEVSAQCLAEMFNTMPLMVAGEIAMLSMFGLAICIGGMLLLAPVYAATKAIKRLRHFEGWTGERAQNTALPQIETMNDDRFNHTAASYGQV